MATQPLTNKIVPDYRDDSRYERIDGCMVERPLPVENHAKVQLNLTFLLRRQVVPLGGEALQEWSIAQSQTADRDDPNYMTPDVVAVMPPMNRTAKGYLLPPVNLAVEISSPEQSGLITKAQLLHGWGVEHVWIINPETRECLEYHGGNQFVIAKDELTAGNLRVTIAEVFEDIQSPPH